jgi:F-type H+-transporting ATPase subunit delta
VRFTTGVGRMALTTHERSAARRYARAILEVARGQGGTVAEATQAEIEALARLLAADAGVREAFLDRALPAEARRRAAAAIASTAKLTPLTAKVLEMLAAHDRLALLPALAEAYRAALNAARGVVTAEAVSAHPLDPEQEKALAASLGRALGAPVDLRTRVDAAVLGGVLVSAGGRTYDGTVRGRLSALRRRLLASS